MSLRSTTEYRGKRFEKKVKEGATKLSKNSNPNSCVKPSRLVADGSQSYMARNRASLALRTRGWGSKRQPHTHRRD